jgi:hypothetical protein
MPNGSLAHALRGWSRFLECDVSGIPCATGPFKAADMRPARIRSVRSMPESDLQANMTD